MKISIAILCLFIATVFAEDGNDKCTGLYKQCINTRGLDVLTRFDCSMKKWKCQMGLQQDEEELSFQADDSKSCAADAKKCFQDKSSDKSGCMESLKKCVAGKIAEKKEEYKKKYECVKKCKSEMYECKKKGGNFKDCLKKVAECGKGCFNKTKGDEDEVLFMDEPSEAKQGKDKCTGIYKKCAAEGVSRMKCGIKYLACRAEEKKEEYKKKYECLKKCKSEMYECKKKGGNFTDCYKKSVECGKGCIKTEGDGDEVLFMDESSEAEQGKNKCTEIYKKCAAEGVSRMKCGIKYLACRAEEKKEEYKKKYECLKKCKSEMYECKKKGGDSKDCYKKSVECGKGCFKTEGDEDEVLFMDEPSEAEQGKDKCIGIYRKCVAEGVGRMKCGFKYLACRAKGKK